ncbi:TIGR02680 family protein [Cryptosporangium sp. NPDC051539]|uniref:TIGR02680 family protein n=1 Tax=Cryptosporangium sp. NPDC051539 TaxID=3363962 RepID=UPI0037BCBD6C
MARFMPTRAGIVNLWDYRDEEFLFVDGWLVLRGPNGSGKTKALEVLFPFVLDGRIEPRRLNPFAGEDRTMKSNLLYRGQESAHAYVWMEFGDGTSFVTIGIGLRAHRHNDRVTRWHFVVDGRVGVDFSLLDADDRPVLRKELIERLGAEAVRDSAEEYRHLVDARLFALGPARYEQLLDLVLTLRKPQLAKDLNPVELSRTLQRGLRPVDDHLLVEAARSFDDMEAVARTLEGLIAADAATTAFLSVYSTYLRTHARAAADALSARRVAVAEQRTTRDEAHEAATRAAAAVSEARTRQDAVEGEPGRLRAHLDRLKGSAAYRSHEQLADLKRHVHDLVAAARRAQAAVAAEQATTDRRLGENDRAQTAAADARSSVARCAADVTAEAGAAGIDWQTEDAELEGLPPRLTARAETRRADVTAVRSAADRLVQAERDHTRAVDEDRAAREATEAAADAEGRAASALVEVREQTASRVRSWGADHADLLSGLELDGIPEVLADSLDAPSLREPFAEAVAAPVATRRDELAALTARRDGLVADRREVTAERTRIAAEHDDAPPPSATRPASRENRPGAPLWQLIRFADDVPDVEAAGIEAALQAAGILDAWVPPDDEDSLVEDAYLRAGPRVIGASLADLLVPEDQEHVPAARITAVLAGIAVGDLTGPAAVTETGGWAQGAGTGRFVKDHGEFIGATARAARRAARIADCDRRIAALDAEITRAEASRQTLRDVIDAVGRAGNALPPLTEIRKAERDLDRAAAALRIRREATADAAHRLDASAAERAVVAATLRRTVAEHHLPVDAISATAAALDRFARAGLQLEHAHLTARQTDLAAGLSSERLAEAEARREEAVEAAHEAAQRHAEKDEELRTLSAAIGAEAEEVLAEVARTEQAVTEAENALASARAALTEARTAEAGALARAEVGEANVDRAITEARADAVRLRPFAQPDLLGLIRCPTELRWPVVEHREGDLDPAVIALHDGILAATRELTPTETSLKQSGTRLTGALTDLQTQLPAAGLDHRPEWDTDEGIIVVRVADEQGLTPVAHFAERVATERRDQEQLLTDAEQQVFEDALLGQLAGQIHRRTIEARDLVDAMDTQMRARRMSSGLTVGVGWRLADDLDSEQREVCRLLERDPARLGPTQLTTLRRHFAARIKAARAQAPEKPYRDLLAEVLDYRQWRTFAFTLHRPGGVTEPLTRARHSQLSGGEQSVSLHLPLFAAANALFGSARSEAPRLLGLDEAFAGVDDTGRGELMSLAKQFDLDLFMTGYDLWATHPSVTGAAHYDLSHSTEEHTVSTVLLVWDGTMNIADFDGTLARALGSPESRRAPVHG